MNTYMKQALQEGLKGIAKRHGGPFGSVIVLKKPDGFGEVVGEGHNEVLRRFDPTCHGEMQAIRNATEELGTYDLSGCDLYTTGEPCPMCLAACMWANIDHIYYGCTIEDNERIGFRDKRFDELMGGREKLKDYMTEIDRDECLKLFDVYQATDPMNY